MNERCSSILESIGDAVVATDEKGNVTYMNPSAEKLTGYTLKESAGKTLYLLCEFSEKITKRTNGKPLPAVLEKGATRSSDTCTLKTKNGRRIPLEVTASPIRNGKGSVVGASLTLRDITKRLQSEETIKEQYRMTSIFYRVSSLAMRSLDEKVLIADFMEVLDEAIKEIKAFEALDIDQRYALFLVDGERMKLVGEHGHTREFVDLHENMKIGDCVCGRAVIRKDFVVSRNSLKDDDHALHCAGMPSHGHIAVPIMVKDKVLGVICLTTAPDVTFDEEKIKMLGIIGNHFGMALENARLYEQTKTLMLHDPLTELANRRHLDIVLEKSFAESRRYDSPLSLIMLDLDHFKEYNDSKGHLAGDQLLVQIASLLNKTLRSTDFVARYGGEEFLVVLPVTNLEEAVNLAERIRCIIEKEAPITVSLGIASYKKELANREELIRRADKALYMAKQRGRNRVECIS